MIPWSAMLGTELEARDKETILRNAFAAAEQKAGGATAAAAALNVSLGSWGQWKRKAPQQFFQLFDLLEYAGMWRDPAVDMQTLVQQGVARELLRMLVEAQAGTSQPIIPVNVGAAPDSRDIFIETVEETEKEVRIAKKPSSDRAEKRRGS